MKKKQIIALTLSAVLSSTILGNPVLVKADSKESIKGKIESNNNKIDELQDKKSDLKDEKSESAKKLEEAKNKFNEQNKLLTETRQKVLGFESEINKLQGEIDTLTNKIKDVEKEIDQVKKEIEKKEKELAKKQEILDKRLRSTYMNNVGDKMIYMLIESKNIGDLLSNIANINIIIKTDQELIAEIENDKSIIESKKKELEDKEKDLTNTRAGIESSQAKVKESKKEVEKLEQEYAQEASKLKALEDERTREYNALSDREKAIQDEISKYEHDNVNLEEYYKNISTPPVTNNNAGSNNSSSGNNESSSNSGSGNSGSTSVQFIKPVNAVITSNYGSRIHPITGKQSFHRGTDFGASSGTPIKAIAGGVVTTAGYNSSFGNMVIIDHGNGYTSLYAHASSLNVSAGQRVSQGQTVSFVGSTGNSTGPHLHLEMRYNGSYVNPMNYIR